MIKNGPAKALTRRGIFSTALDAQFSFTFWQDNEFWHKNKRILEPHFLDKPDTCPSVVFNAIRAPYAHDRMGQNQPSFHVCFFSPSGTQSLSRAKRGNIPGTAALRGTDRNTAVFYSFPFFRMGRLGGRWLRDNDRMGDRRMDS